MAIRRVSFMNFPFGRFPTSLLWLRPACRPAPWLDRPTMIVDCLSAPPGGRLWSGSATLTMASYNLIRLPKLIEAAT
jgi:hypothetical protein